LGFKDFSLASGMLSTTVNAANSAQICPKLPKFAQRQNFEIPPKNQDFSVFQKQKFVRVEEALEHVFTVRIFNPRDFYVFSIVKKRPLYVNFSIPLTENDFFLNVPHLL
jgi:hypothetical protein